ncbi:MAG: hypothetical protein WCG75_12605 [Armatimonadota bacterium]
MVLRAWLGIAGFVVFQSLALVCGFLVYLEFLASYVHLAILLGGLPFIGWALTIGSERLFGWVGISSSAMEAVDEPTHFFAWRVGEFEDLAQDEELFPEHQQTLAELPSIQV